MLGSIPRRPTEQIAKMCIRLPMRHCFAVPSACDYSRENRKIDTARSRRIVHYVVGAS